MSMIAYIDRSQNYI